VEREGLEDQITITHIDKIKPSKSQK